MIIEEKETEKNAVDTATLMGGPKGKKGIVSLKIHNFKNFFLNVYFFFIFEIVFLNHFLGKGKGALRGKGKKKRGGGPNNIARMPVM
mgnify:CR=1 FL=1